jgi:centromeric protein E
LSARLQLDTQATQILSLEAALDARPPAAGTEDEKDKVIADQAKTIKELEIVVKGYEGLYEKYVLFCSVYRFLSILIAFIL